MSKESTLAVIGTVAFAGAAVTSALAVDPLAIRVALIAVALAVPGALWLTASRHRGTPRARAVLLWGLSTEFAVMVIVDFIGWIVDANP